MVNVYVVSSAFTTAGERIQSKYDIVTRKLKVLSVEEKKKEVHNKIPQMSYS